MGLSTRIVGRDGTVSGGTSLGTITPVQGQNWKGYTETFQATSNSELLTFAGLIGSQGQTLDNDAGLANVNVKVPEPAMALLLPFGLLFVSGIRKRFLA